MKHVTPHPKRKLLPTRGLQILTLVILAVSTVLSHAARPVSIFSHGNGLFYGSALTTDMPAANQGELLLKAEAGYRPVHVNAYMPVNATAPVLAEFAIAWVRDDDCAFQSGFSMQTTTGALANGLQGFENFRPISISGYRLNPGETRYSVAFIRDDSGLDWQFILDKTGAQYQVAVENLVNQGYRALSVSGCSFNGAGVRFSAIFVKDGLPNQDWATHHGVREADYQLYIEEWVDKGFWPISLSAYPVGGETHFTTVMVRTTGSGANWVARHGLTEAGLAAENASWTSANNPNNKTYRPVVAAAYQSGGTGGPKRFAAVWRTSSKRVFTTTGNPQPLLQAFDDTMESIMKSKDVNAASLCVAKDGQIKLHRGYTWAPDEFPVTPPNARFRIASASKAVTAVAVMKLLESNIITGMKDGGLQALTLDTPVFQINGMPDLPAAYGRAANLITIRDLLRHRAGWDRNVFEPLYSDVTVASALGVNLPVSRQDMIDYMMSPALWPTPNDPTSIGYMNSPDSVWAYSNFGFSVLAELIEEMSNEPYEDYVRGNVLLPVGANRTFLGRTARLWGLNNPDEVIYTAGGSTNPRWYVSDSNYDPMAVGNPTTQSRVALSEPGAAFPTTPYGRFNVHTIDAAGGWVSSTDDMVRLLKSFHTYDPNGPQTDTPILKWDSVQEMWSEPANVSANVSIGGDYLLGWQRTTVCGPSGNVTAWYHGGAIDGAMTLICHRSDGVSFAVSYSRLRWDPGFTALNNVACAIASWPLDLAPPRFTAIPAQTVSPCTPSSIAFQVEDDSTPSESILVAARSTDPSVDVQVVGRGSDRHLEVRPEDSRGGIAVIILLATDLDGQSTEQRFDLAWAGDRTAPVITCPSNIVVQPQGSRGTEVRWEIDATDAAIGRVEVDCDPAPGTLFPIGTSVVTCFAEDNCGNVDSCTFTVTVQRPRLGFTTGSKPGAMALSWGTGFVLEQADEVTGPWRLVRSATSPFPLDFKAPKRFFNLAPDFKYHAGATFDMNLFEQNIRNFLEDECVGFSYAIGLNGQLDRSGAWGKARTSADGPQLNMTATKRVNVASVSKTITAVAVLKLLEETEGVTVNSPVAPYLPSDWILGPGSAGLTFKDLLTHKSGLAGASSDFDTLRGYIQQGLGAKTYNYQNSNFALFRVIIPYLWGIVPWAPNSTVEEITAEVYQYYVQENIFKPMGINNAWNKPTDANPVLLYRWPYDGSTGHNPGDFTLKAGAYGWNLSAFDLAAFLAHLRYGDILEPETRAQMDDQLLGWGASSTQNGDHGTYYGHNGGLKYSPQPWKGMRSCIMDYPNGVQVGIIINSRDGDYPSPASLLKQAFDNAWVE